MTKACEEMKPFMTHSVQYPDTGDNFKNARTAALKSELLRIQSIIQNFQANDSDARTSLLYEIAPGFWLELTRDEAFRRCFEKIVRLESMLQENRNSTTSHLSDSIDEKKLDDLEIVEIEEFLDDNDDIISSTVKPQNNIQRPEEQLTNLKNVDRSQLPVLPISSNGPDVSELNDQLKRISSNALYELELIAEEIDVEDSFSEDPDSGISEDDDYADELLYGPGISLLPKQLTLDHKLLAQLERHNPQIKVHDKHDEHKKRVRFADEPKIKEVEDISESLAKIEHKKAPLRFKGERMNSNASGTHEGDLQNNGPGETLLMDVVERADDSDADVIQENTDGEVNVNFRLRKSNGQDVDDKIRDLTFELQATDNDSLDKLALEYYNDLYNKNEEGGVLIDEVEDFRDFNQKLESSVSTPSIQNFNTAVNDDQSDEEIVTSSVVERSSEEEDSPSEESFLQREIEEAYLRVKTSLALKESAHLSEDHIEADDETAKLSRFKEARLRRK